MTVLIALKDKKGIHLASDSQGTWGNKILHRRNTSKFISKKIKINDGYGETIKENTIHIGVTGYAFLNEYLQYGLDLPPMEENKKFEEYLSRTLLPKIMKKLTENKLVEIDNSEVDTKSLFMIIYNGQIYTINRNLSFGIIEDEYASFGSGSEVALGVLYATKNTKLNGYERCKLAIKACDYHTVYVDGHMKYKYVPKKNKP